MPRGAPPPMRVLGAALLLLVALAALAPAAPAPGERTLVAVIDTGIRASHVEFAPGQVVAWKDFVNGRPAPYDDHGHGTATASLVAGANRNTCAGEPKMSFSPGAPLAIAKVLTSGGSLPSARILAEAIDWSVAQGARVISISIGGGLPGTDDPSVNAAVQRALAADVLVVVSAGNGLGDTGLPSASFVRSFSNIPNVMPIGAANRGGSASANMNMLGDVTSWGLNTCTAYDSGDADYVLWSGTSFSTPLVAGMAARAMEIADANGAPADAPHVRQLLMRSATNSVTVPYAREGMGFLLDDEWPTVAAHAATGRLPDYDAQGPHAGPERQLHETMMPALRSLP